MNPMMPPGQMPPQGPPQGMPQGGPPPGPMGNPLESQLQNHQQQSAFFEKLQTAKETLSAVRKEMDALLALGDTVSPSDVVKMGGGLVAAGLTPKAVAGLLADMPQGGEALQAWVKGHDQDVTAREQQLAQVMQQTQHQMGTSALSILSTHGKAMQGQMSMGAQPAALPSSGGDGQSMSPGNALGVPSNG